MATPSIVAVEMELQKCYQTRMLKWFRGERVIKMGQLLSCYCKILQSLVCH
jgi:hypothetical protein